MQKKNVPIGSDVSSGTYECANCKDNTYSAQSNTSMPPCGVCKGNGDNNADPFRRGWNILSGRGDAKDDPYPGKK